MTDPSTQKTAVKSSKEKKALLKQNSPKRMRPVSLGKMDKELKGARFRKFRAPRQAAPIQGSVEHLPPSDQTAVEKAREKRAKRAEKRKKGTI